jgi:hypothetical protein
VRPGPRLRAVGFGTAVACAALLAGLASVYAAQVRTLSLSIGDLEAPGFSAQTLRAQLSGPNLQDLTLEIDRLTAAGRTWRKAKLSCPGAELTAARIACPRGVLDAGGKIPVSFSYITARRELLAEVKPAADEIWRIAGRFDGKTPSVETRIEKARIERLAPWLPPNLPKLSGGRASGSATLQGENLKVRLDVEGLAFADASGLHAGEKIVATLEGDAVGRRDDWRWNARLTWRSGEVFWQPFFAAGKGHGIEAQGTTVRGITAISKGRLDIPGVGIASFAGQWNHAKGVLTAYEASAARLGVAALYDGILKPLVQGTALSDLRADGQVSVSVKGAGDTLATAQIEFGNVSFEDRQRRFAVFGLNGRVPWRQGEQTTGELTIKGAEFLKVPVGAVRALMRVRTSRVDIVTMRVPIFDGAVVLRDFAAAKADDGWRWRFSGEVVPISMVQLTGAFDLPLMHGALAGKIPELRYRRGTIAMDGALDMRVFDGTVRASKVQLIQPFGRAPRFHADVEIRNMDLELLTRTFDFGTITGRIDATVLGLELVNWQPTRMDARIASSAGSYPRKISQRAVQNISALGGAGAAAAIQRSLLRFFDEFGYDRIGLSCRLENNVCEMDGVERAPQGYVIVKGGGIPAISVIGYNRSVNWRELVDRLKRITQENVKPIVK